MYSSDIIYEPKSKYSLSLYEYFHEDYQTMKKQIPNAKTAEELRTLLNKYCYFSHWTIISDDENQTVLSNKYDNTLLGRNKDKTSPNLIIVKKYLTKTETTIKNQPDDVLIRELKSRGYTITK